MPLQRPAERLRPHETPCRNRQPAWAEVDPTEEPDIITADPELETEFTQQGIAAMLLRVAALEERLGPAAPIEWKLPGDGRTMTGRAFLENRSRGKTDGTNADWTWSCPTISYDLPASATKTGALSERMRQLVIYKTVLMTKPAADMLLALDDIAEGIAST